MKPLSSCLISDPGDFGRVAVLLGGRSAERAVSLESGRAVLAALLERGVDAVEVDVGGDVVEQLLAGGYDRAFIALHGRGGEDGVIQGALETLGLAYTGSGVQGSALAMDKFRCKALWQGLGLPTPPFEVLTEQSDARTVVDSLGLPLMVKPAREGSSIGMTKVTAAAQLEAARQLAAGLDDVVLAEGWIEGAEYTVAILQDRALPVIRLETPRVFYDYEAKYEATDTGYHCPCGLPADAERRLQALALRAFESVGASGWGRVDVMCDSQGELWLLEVNTVPGMTDHSLLPMAGRAVGIGFDELVWRVLETSL